MNERRITDYFVDLVQLGVKVEGLNAEIAQLRADLAARDATIAGLLNHVSVDGRLGIYLNTMVADIGVMDRGQYLRDLFGEFTKEAVKLATPNDASHADTN